MSDCVQKFSINELRKKKIYKLTVNSRCEFLDSWNTNPKKESNKNKKNKKKREKKIRHIVLECKVKGVPQLNWK